MINNNRQQNGRRRGRGGQRQGGGNQGNGSRIDNRARGNAAQLLEKYKSLAADAQRQGDRVNTEYYLQFADHYFRVVSEQRGRFEEQDRQRREGQGQFDSSYDGDDDFDGDDQDSRQDNRQDNRQDGRQDSRGEGGRNENQGQREGNRDQGREQRRFDGNREGGRDGSREPRRERFQRDRDEGPTEGVPATEGEPIAAEQQPTKPRRARAPRRDDSAAGDTFDAALLPPSFAPANDGAAADAADEGEAKPRRRRLRPAGEASAG